MRKYIKGKNTLPSVTTITSKIEPFYEREEYNISVIRSSCESVLKNKSNKNKPIDLIIDNIISGYSKLKYLPLDLGSYVHSTINNYIENKVRIDYKNENKEVKGALLGWKDFEKLYKPKHIFSELTVYNNRYAGTIDLISEIKGKVYLIDIKTSNFKDDKCYFSRSHLLQVSMYYNCLKYMIENNISSSEIKQKDTKTERDINISINDKGIEKIKKLVKSPKVALLYLNKNDRRFLFLEYSKKEINACINEVDTFLNYLDVRKSMLEVTKGSRYIKLK